MKTTAACSEWYNTQFLTDSLKHYLDSRGFYLYGADEEQPYQPDKIIIAKKLLSKEIIEIRGTVDEATELPTKGQGSKKINHFMDAVKLISGALLPPIRFFSSQNIDQKTHCICLPDIEQHRWLIQKVEEYFIANRMHLKIYFVKQNGSVRAINLNPAKRNRKQRCRKG